MPDADACSHRAKQTRTLVMEHRVSPTLPKRQSGVSIGCSKLPRWVSCGAHFHEGVGYRYNAIAPVSGLDDGLNLTARAHILPLYYAFLIVDEAVGSSGTAKVAELATLNSSITSYGIWEGGRLVRAVIIDSQVYLNDTDSDSRTGFDVSLEGWSDGGGQTTIKRLSTPFTTAYSGM